MAALSVATADINSRHVASGVGIAAGILWAKDWIFRHEGRLGRVDLDSTDLN